MKPLPAHRAARAEDNRSNIVGTPAPFTVAAPDTQAIRESRLSLESDLELSQKPTGLIIGSQRPVVEMIIRHLHCAERPVA